MTIVVEGDNLFIEQVVKQLHKLVDVIKVSDITDEPTVDRDLVLFKVQAEPSVRGEIMQICEIFRLRIVDFGRRSLVLEATGEKNKLDAIEDALRPFGIIEMVRTGQVSMVRGKH
jgi:acetolactate synthase-1/3 small subunit